MKLTKLSLAIALGFTATAAMALPYTSYTNTGEDVGNTLNIRFSGATAVDPGIIASAIFLCDTTQTIHRYSVSSNAVVFCQIDQVKLPGTGKTNLAVYKYSIGGSGGGVGNVNNATLIPFIDLTKMGASECTVSGTVNPAFDIDGTNPLPAIVDTLCSGASNNPNTTTNAVSSLGVSDVEPQFFGPAVGNYNNLDSGALATVLFGIPVTKNVYVALQKSQGLLTTSTPVAGTCAADNQTVPCMANITQAQVTSLYTQGTNTGFTWATLFPGTVIRNDADTADSPDQLVYVARRVNTSGTQKTFEALVARTGNTSTGGRVCQPSVDSFVSGPNAADNTAVTISCGTTPQRGVRNNGSGQVVQCMNVHDAADRGAVGILSLEYKQNTGPADAVRFLKVNGVAPTYAGLASGAYTYYGDVALNLRNATVAGVGPTASLTGYSAFVTALRTNFASPATIEIINGSNQPFGPSGLMALDALATPAVASLDFTGATARNPWSRLVGNTTLNNCQPGKRTPTL